MFFIGDPSLADPPHLTMFQYIWVSSREYPHPKLCESIRGRRIFVISICNCPELYRHCTVPIPSLYRPIPSLYHHIPCLYRPYAVLIASLSYHIPSLSHSVTSSYCRIPTLYRPYTVPIMFSHRPNTVPIPFYTFPIPSLSHPYPILYGR